MIRSFVRKAHRSVKRTSMCVIVAVIALCGVERVAAAPYADTGDVELRHDLEYLADRSLLSVPITTWPMSWADITAAYESVDPARVVDPGSRSVMRRLEARLAAQTRWGLFEGSYSLGLTEQRTRLRTFADRPRGTVELEARLEYTGNSFAANIQLGVVDDGLDSESIRLDGSYIGYIFGNVGVTAGSQDAWWGPGHAGSLILSSNARPVPGIAVKRNVATPFRSKWLKWIGPWTAHAFAGQMESDRFVSRPYLLGARVAIKPLRSLELGVSRTAQWGGEGRPDSLRSLVNLIIGRDNVGEGISRAEEPGNQLAGFDARLSINRFRLPITFYGQLIGEDEAGGFPSRYLGQGGVSTSFALPSRESTVRVNLEVSDTTCQFYESVRRFNCAYNNGIYSTGYRYRGRAVGHSTDNDTSEVAVIATLNGADRNNWQAVLRSGRLNRGGALDIRNTLTTTRVDYIELDVGHSRPLLGGKIELGLGITDSDFIAAGTSDSDLRLYARWNSVLR